MNKKNIFGLKNNFMIYQSVLENENIAAIISWLKSKNTKKIFLITGKNSFHVSGSKNYLTPLLDEYDYTKFSDFDDNPQLKDVYRGIELFKSEGCDCCIAVGGGSVIDMAKLVSSLVNEDVIKLPEKIRSNIINNSREIPLCVIPTTAGSGSESTHFAVVYIDHQKYSLAHPSILPDLVNLNANLSYSLNPYLKAITSLDALFQSIESFWSKKSTAQSRIYSSKAIDLLWNNLKQSVLENNYEAHKKVVQGSNLAGKAINIAKTTAAHAFSYFFTTHHNIRHGHAVSLTIGKIYQFNKSHVQYSDKVTKQIFTDLDKLLGIEEDSISVIENFISDLNIELDFSKLNINIKKELPNIKKEVNLERLNNNPFKIKEKDFENILINPLV